MLWWQNWFPLAHKSFFHWLLCSSVSEVVSRIAEQCSWFLFGWHVGCVERLSLGILTDLPIPWNFAFQSHCSRKRQGACRSHSFPWLLAAELRPASHWCTNCHLVAHCGLKKLVPVANSFGMLDSQGSLKFSLGPFWNGRWQTEGWEFSPQNPRIDVVFI